MPARFCVDRSNTLDIARHLTACDSQFIPPLSGRVEIDTYAHKIAARAMRFEAWEQDDLIGLVAAYFNSEQGVAFITSVSVLPSHQNRGIASTLLNQCIARVEAHGLHRLELEVDKSNTGALALYGKKGFAIDTENSRSVIEYLNLGKVRK